MSGKLISQHSNGGSNHQTTFLSEPSGVADGKSPPSYLI